MDDLIVPRFSLIKFCDGSIDVGPSNQVILPSGEKLGFDRSYKIKWQPKKDSKVIITSGKVILSNDNILSLRQVASDLAEGYITEDQIAVERRKETQGNDEIPTKKPKRVVKPSQKRRSHAETEKLVASSKLNVEPKKSANVKKQDSDIRLYEKILAMKKARIESESEALVKLKETTSLVNNSRATGNQNINESETLDNSEKENCQSGGKGKLHNPNSKKETTDSDKAKPSIEGKAKCCRSVKKKRSLPEEIVFSDRELSDDYEDEKYQSDEKEELHNQKVKDGTTDFKNAKPSIEGKEKPCTSAKKKQRLPEEKEMNSPTTFQKSSLQQSLYFGPDGSVSQEKTSSLSSLLCLDDEDDANEVSSASSVSKSVSPPTSLIRPPTIPDYQWLLGRVQNLESDLAALRMELSEMKRSAHSNSGWSHGKKWKNPNFPIKDYVLQAINKQSMSSFVSDLMGILYKPEYFKTHTRTSKNAKNKTPMDPDEQIEIIEAVLKHISPTPALDEIKRAMTSVFNNKSR